jgi:hypothetical protein
LSHVDDWRRIADLARLTPTPHNTQPFRIRPRGAHADLVLLTERLLPEEDHGNLYVPSSFGIFLAMLERAARHIGRTIATDPIPELDTAQLPRKPASLVIGHASLTGECTPETQERILSARRTSRLPYETREVAPDTIEALVRTAETLGHRFVSISDPSVVGPLLRLNAEAIIDNLQLDRERDEIRGWHRLGPTPEFGDGLWQDPMNQPAWELRSAFAVPRLFTWPVFRGFAVHRYLTTQRGTRHIGLLCGPFKAWPELVVAGRMLLDLWLKMAEREVYMQPFGSLLTNPHYAKIIAEQFGVKDCWLIMRFGYSPPPPRAPRLKSILIDE